ncbi:MAG: hypothetical protein HC896_15295 [Bacteroidales bacterium]|nr:hypothetical protein [Bacteroidales bacterium]
MHIFGGTYGDYLKQSQYSAPDFQNRVAKSYIENQHDKNPYLKRIIWIPPGLNSHDQRQELLINRIKRQENNKATEILQAPLSELKRSIFRHLNASDEKKPVSHVKNSVYYMSDGPAKGYFAEIQKTLADLGHKLVLLDHNLPGLISQHINILLYCESVILDYNGNTNWLNAKQADINKINGYGRQAPYKFIVF